jgi:hypothetical protein
LTSLVKTKSRLYEQVLLVTKVIGKKVPKKLKQHNEHKQHFPCEILEKDPIYLIIQIELNKDNVEKFVDNFRPIKLSFQNKKNLKNSLDSKIKNNRIFPQIDPDCFSVRGDFFFW